MKVNEKAYSPMVIYNETKTACKFTVPFSPLSPQQPGVSPHKEKKQVVVVSAPNTNAQLDTFADFNNLPSDEESDHSLVLNESTLDESSCLEDSQDDCGVIAPYVGVSHQVHSTVEQKTDLFPAVTGESKEYKPAGSKPTLIYGVREKKK